MQLWLYRVFPLGLRPRLFSSFPQPTVLDFTQSAVYFFSLPWPWASACCIQNLGLKGKKIKLVLFTFLPFKPKFFIQQAEAQGLLSFSRPKVLDFTQNAIYLLSLHGLSLGISEINRRLFLPQPRIFS